MLGLILFGLFIIAPGWLLWLLLRKEPSSFVENAAYSIALGSANLVLLFATRNLYSWPFWVFLVLIPGECFALALTNWKRGNFGTIIPSLPKPEMVTLALAAIQALMIVAILDKSPLFPSTSEISPDYLTANNLAQDYLRNGAPLATELFYYGVHWHITLADFLNPTDNPLLIERVVMGILVVFSTFYLYLATKRLAGEWAAVGTCAIYCLPAYLWFGMVYDSGFYPNFFGLIAMLFLIVALKDYMGEETHWLGGATLIVLMAFAFAAFSHYSVVLILPALLAVALYDGIRTKQYRKSGLLVALVGLPALFFGNTLLSLASGLLQGGGGPSLSSDALASMLSGIQSLAYSTLIITDDTATVFFLLVCLPLYLSELKRRKDAWFALPMLLSVSVLAFSPNNGNAWRFAFVALLPLTMIFGTGISRIGISVLSRMSLSRRKIGTRYKPRLTFLGCVALGLILLPSLYGSWGTNAVSYSSIDAAANRQHDYALYNAMEWMAAQRCTYQVNATYAEPIDCSFVTPNDGKLTSSLLVSGRTGVYDPSLSDSGESLYFYALNNQKQFIVTTNIHPSYPCYSYQIQLLPLNATSGKAMGVAIRILRYTNDFRLVPYNGSASLDLLVNGTQVGTIGVANGKTNGSLQFQRKATLDVQVRSTIVYSNTMRVFAEQDRAPVDIPANEYACYPWYWTSSQIGHEPLVYNSTDVHVFCVEELTKCPKSLN